MLKPNFPVALGETPLTDPRSLGGSALFHTVLVLLASYTVLSAALPMAADSSPKALYAEIDPVDNRADVPSSPGQGVEVPEIWAAWEIFRSCRRRTGPFRGV